ncbi:MAG: helix-turn-helix transcriptional regulator [Clostridia bacterium]|nr:helix-turn-helix transcriptional regulator [Clostridia bacterium]
MPKESLSSLTEPMYYVLLALTEPLCGTEIMEKVRVLSHERLSIGPGTLYTMLAKFEDNGLIEPADHPSPGSGKRKNYLITEKGAWMLKAEYSRLKRQTEDGKDIMEALG